MKEFTFCALSQSLVYRKASQTFRKVSNETSEQINIDKRILSNLWTKLRVNNMDFPYGQLNSQFFNDFAGLRIINT